MRKHCALPSSSKYALHSKAMFILDWLFIYPYILNFQGRCRIMLIHGVQSKHHQMSWTSWNFEANGDLLALAASQRDSQCLILGPRGIPGGTEAYRWGTSRYPLFQHVSTYIYLVHPGPHFFVSWVSNFRYLYDRARRILVSCSWTIWPTAFSGLVVQCGEVLKPPSRMMNEEESVWFILWNVPSLANQLGFF